MQKQLFIYLLLTIMLMGTCNTLHAAIRYVKSTASGTGDGSSWANASADLQAMINASMAGDEVWVAAGTYKPITNADRGISFSMKNDLTIYGGFPNTGNPVFTDRNWGTNVTILSGDIGVVSNSSDNCYSVIRNTDLNNTAILDGFTVTEGFADGFVNETKEGPAMYNTSASPTIKNCIFTGNVAARNGVAVLNSTFSNPIFINCLISNNSSPNINSGAIFNFHNSSSTLINCTISGNTNGGGVIGNFDHTATILKNCILWGNSTTGILAFSNDCTISVEYSTVQGGFSGTGNLDADPLFVNAAAGNFQLQACSPAIDAGTNVGTPTTDLNGTNRPFNAYGIGLASSDMGAYEYSTPVNYCTSCISANILYVKANATGANNGTSWSNAIRDLQKALAIANACPGIQQIWVAAGTYKPTLGTNRDISFSLKNGLAIYGGFNGTETQLSHRNWANNTTIISGDLQGNDGPNYTNYSDNSLLLFNHIDNGLNNTALLDGFTITAGSSNFRGGAAYHRGSSPTFVNCTFLRNYSASVGGAIYNEGGAAPRFINCLFIGNGAVDAGGAIFNLNASPIITNCTFNNQLGSVLHHQDNSNATVTNSILWGNSGQAVSSGPNGGATNITYSIVQGGYSGTGNLNADPLFVNAAGGDLRLQACSPAINAGSNTAVPSGITTDLAGNPRFFNNGTVDMGAYEFQGSPTPIMAVCQSQTVELNSVGTGTLAASALNNSSTGCGLLSFSVNGQSSLSFSCANAGSNNITLTVTDSRNQSVTCMAIVTVQDNTAPTINCPATQTLVLGANCSATLPDYTNLATTGDNCGVQNVTQSPAAGTSVSGTGNMTVTLTVTDVNGNETECTFTVTKVDNTPPTISCPNTQTLVLGANCSASLPDYTSLANSGDNCGVQGVTQSPAAGTTVSTAGNMTVTLTVTDLNSNETECTFTVTKVDQTPPTISCPATQTLVLGANCSAALPDYTSLVSTGDNCGVQSVTQSPVAGTTVSSAGNMTVTLTVTDVNGLTNTCTFTVTKVDNTAPTITCPATQTLGLGANCSAALPDYTSLVSTGDNCGVQSVTQSPLAGTTVSSAGNMTVTLTVTDVNGLTNTCTFTVTKADQTPPTISNCPNNQNVLRNASCMAILPNYTGFPITGDNCPGGVTVSQMPAPGTIINSTITVSLTAMDAAGNMAMCSFTATPVDQTPPTITCPATQTLVLGANCTATLPNYTSLATTGDNCGVQSVTQSPAVGTTVSGTGNMTVRLTVTDLNGNETECTFTVTKVDNTPPTISCPNTQTLTLGANCSASLPDYTNLATTGDNCGVQSVTQSPAAGTTIAGAGNMTVTLTVTDVNGLTNTCTFTVTKVDNTPPSITCPTTQTLVLGSSCTATLPNYTSLAATGDNCGVQSVTQSPAAGTTVSSAGNMTVTLTVTDVNGLTNSCTFTVTKVDNTPPTVQCFNQTLNFNGEESIALDADDLAEASDNCGVQSISLSPNTISATQVGQTVPVTVTATDINGNTATCTAQITVSGFPAGWSQQPGGAGCAGNNNTYNPANGVWTATSTNCFYGPPYTSDATSFAQRTLCGNGSITAQVTSISGNGWAGIVMRESNAPGAKKAQLMTNLSSLHRREFRTSTNGAAQPQQSASNGRYWLRITRAGNQFTMSVSANGTSWFLIGAQTIVMSNCIQMGLIATNYTANSTVTATFAGVSFSGSNATATSFELRASSLESPYSFEVYPNPTGGELNVDLTQYFGRSVRLEVYSLEGKLLQFSELNEVQSTLEHIDLKGFQNGMYLLKVKSAGLPDATKRVVLQRG